MKRYILIAISILAGWLINTPVMAQKFAVAYIDMQYILKISYQTLYLAYAQ